MASSFEGLRERARANLSMGVSADGSVDSGGDIDVVVAFIDAYAWSKTEAGRFDAQQYALGRMLQDLVRTPRTNQWNTVHARAVRALEDAGCWERIGGPHGQQWWLRHRWDAAEATGHSRLVPVLQLPVHVRSTATVTGSVPTLNPSGLAAQVRNVRAIDQGVDCGEGLTLLRSSRGGAGAGSRSTCPAAPGMQATAASTACPEAGVHLPPHSREARSASSSARLRTGDPPIPKPLSGSFATPAAASNASKIVVP